MKRHRTTIIPKLSEDDWYDVNYPWVVYVGTGFSVHTGQCWIHDNAPGTKFSAGFGERSGTYFRFERAAQNVATAFRLVFGQPEPPPRQWWE